MFFISFFLSPTAINTIIIVKVNSHNKKIISVYFWASRGINKCQTIKTFKL